jgi:hypothetical protein
LTFARGPAKCFARRDGGKSAPNFVTPDELDTYYSLVATGKARRNGTYFAVNFGTSNQEKLAAAIGGPDLLAA